MRGAGTVGTHEQVLAPPRTRQLFERRTHHRDVIGRGVAARVARAQHHRQRLAGALAAVIGEHPQPVMAEPALERRCRVLLVRVRGDQRGVQVNRQRRIRTRVTTATGLPR